MSTCAECGGPTETCLEVVHKVLGQRRYTNEVRAERCTNTRCREVYYEGKDLLDIEQLIVRQLAEHGITSGDEFRLLRKYQGLRVADLAVLLGVTPETIAQWEAGESAPSAPACASLAAMMRDQLASAPAARD